MIVCIFFCCVYINKLFYCIFIFFNWGGGVFLVVKCLNCFFYFDEKWREMKMGDEKNELEIWLVSVDGVVKVMCSLRGRI